MKTNLTKSTIIKHSRITTILVVVIALLSGTGELLGQTPVLDADAHPKFVNTLPVIKDLGLRIDMTTGKPKKLVVQMRETFQDLGLEVNGGPVMTRVWGYKFPDLPTTYPGATIVAMKDQPVQVKWMNKLPGHFLPVDVSLHMAHPKGIDAGSWYAAGNVAAVTHLHGGHTESASDGLPEAWFSQNFRETGDFFVKRDYWYDNDQEAATLWYHDHALGITRLNVYAGLAGFYLLRDDHENGLINSGVLPSGDYEIEVVVQDRMFTPDGQLFLPSQDGDPFFDGVLDGQADLGGVQPSIVAEFFGDFILVNGKAWPKLDVEQTKYRFRLLNGSDSRVYKFRIKDGSGDIPFMQIGTDNGLLEFPVTMTSLVLAPGERADLVVDFTGRTGSFTIVNEGPDEPFKGGNFNTDITRPTGQIMRFDVVPGTNPPAFTVVAGSNLRPAIVPLTQTGATRKLALFEGSDADGRLQPLLGVIDGDNAKGVDGVVNGSLAWFEGITENPGLDDVEVWEVYNATEDAHPIHLHLVSFQILGRAPFTATVNSQPQVQHDGASGGVGGYVVESSINLGSLVGPAPNEAGWKDTFVVPPGYMGKVIAKFDRPGRYVWHCHILSHEDHEMMRPFHVGPMPDPAARKGFEELVEAENYPNPFRTETRVQFELKQAQHIDFNVYDVQGKMVYTHQKSYPEGKNAIFWDGFDNEGKILKTGVYTYRLEGETFNESDRLVIQR